MCIKKNRFVMIFFFVGTDLSRLPLTMKRCSMTDIEAREVSDYRTSALGDTLGHDR